MKIIFEYPIYEVTDRFQLVLPERAEILSIQVQYNRIMMWILVDTSNNKEYRNFRIIGTGNPIDEINLLFLGTVQLDGFVWHIFEEVE